MLRVAWKGVLARKLRLMLTSIAIVLGVGFVSGAFFLTDSMRASFDTLFTEAAAGIDAQVQTKELKDLLEAQASQGPASVPIDLAKVGVPPDVLARVEDVPGVHKAVGTIFQNGAQALDKKGKPIKTGGAPSFGSNWVDEAEDVGALRIAKGDAPDRDEVMLDATTMDRGKFKVGDKVTMLIQGGRSIETFTISGVVEFGSSNNLLGASIAVFETSRVQELFDMGDRFTAVDIQADDGVTQATITRRVRQVVGPEYDVVTGEQFTQEQNDSIGSAFLDFLQYIILGFAAVAVFVGAFTIFNTFTILVNQRTREFGLLRAVGASRRQVLGIVIVEALVVGFIASTLGIAVGYGLAVLLGSILNSVSDGGFPSTNFTLQARTVVWSYSVGMIVTLVASLYPSWRAARLSPLEALRANPARSARGWVTPIVGALLFLLGAGLLVSGFVREGASTKSVLLSIGVGCAVAIIGIALLSRLFILPVTRLFALALGRGTTGELATRNVLRNRGRSATTSSALMIGLALASLVLIMHASILKTINHQIDEILQADITVYNSTALDTGIGTVDDDIVERIGKVDGVADFAGQRVGSASLRKTFDPKKDLETFVALDQSALRKDGIVALDMKSGSREPGDGLLVDADLADKRDWKVGDDVRLAFSGGTKRTLEVRGIYEPNNIVGGTLVSSKETFDAVQPPELRAAAGVYVRVEVGVGAKTVVRRIEHDLGTDANFLEIQDSEELRTTFEKQFEPVLLLVLAMLGLSLVIALFGIGNTLALNVFERTREIGLIRAVGGTRWQLRWMIVIEAILVALFGALVGVVVGLAAGRALIKALEDEGFIFAPNVVGLALVLVAGFIAGLLAALLPARRAAKTDVLEAIATE